MLYLKRHSHSPRKSTITKFCTAGLRTRGPQKGLGFFPNMPVKIKKSKGKYTVSTPGGVKGRNMTRANALKQANLLRAVEHDWKPTGKPARRRY